MSHPIKLDHHPKSGAWVEFWEAPSHSNPNDAYIVARKNDGTWGCACPRWIYRRENCKHIKDVLRYMQTPQAAKAPARKSTISPEKMQKALSRFALIE